MDVKDLIALKLQRQQIELESKKNRELLGALSQVSKDIQNMLSAFASMQTQPKTKLMEFKRNEIGQITGATIEQEKG